MSTSITLDIIFGEKVSPRVSIVKKLMNAGWVIRHNNQITFLPINDMDFYNWTSRDIEEQSFFEIVERKEILNEPIGIELYWKDTDVGIVLLIINSTKISFNISINRKYLFADIKILDFNWYAERLIPCFSKYNKIFSYEFSFLQ